MRGEVPNHTLLCFPQSPKTFSDQRERKLAMRPYETMIVFDTTVDAQSIQIALDRALETIRANEGTPGNIDRWGTKSRSVKRVTTCSWSSAVSRRPSTNSTAS